jgi:hypothetical protein
LGYFHILLNQKILKFLAEDSSLEIVFADIKEAIFGSFVSRQKNKLFIFTIMKLIGPFKQILTLNNLPLRGKISDEQLEIIENGGILINDENLIEAIGDFEELVTLSGVEVSNSTTSQFSNSVVLPAFVDCHTHICFGGNIANDFAISR